MTCPRLDVNGRIQPDRVRGQPPVARPGRRVIRRLVRWTYTTRPARAAGAGPPGRDFDMSVLVIGKFKGDTAKFQQAMADRGDEVREDLRGIQDRWRAASPVRHRRRVRPDRGRVGERRAVPDVHVRPGPAGLHRLGRSRPRTARGHRGPGDQLAGPVLTSSSRGCRRRAANRPGGGFHGAVCGGRRSRDTAVSANPGHHAATEPRRCDSVVVLTTAM